MILQHIIHTIESVAPLQWQEEWDNSGLQVGDRNADIQAALLTIDITESVVREAIERHCNLIISHHPLLFHGLKSLTGTTTQERIVETLIRHHIAAYSAHTSLDAALHGVSGQMGRRIGMTDYHILCGEPGADHGLGVIGRLTQPVSFDTLLQQVKAAFGATYIRYIRPKNDPVQTIAICGGAGAELMTDAIHQSADVFLSADFKYHDMTDAQGRIGIIDLDHWISEQYTRELLADILKGTVTTYIAQSDYTPVQIISQ